MAEDQTLSPFAEIPTNDSADKTQVASPEIPTRESDSSDSDNDEEAQLSLQIQSLETNLSTDPNNYEAHVQYIAALRKQGELDKLRRAREAMSALFPLTPEMWQEWAKDETSLCSGTAAYSAVEELYERGVSDYLSVVLWCNYLTFLQEYDPSVRECAASGISKARDLFERAITAAGLHVVEGSRIWEMYREFEQAILFTFPETDSESKEKQVQRIRSLFHRQLSVPLADISSTLLAYKSWETEQGTLDANSDNLDGLPSHVALAYRKALEMLNARMHLEEQISRKDLTYSEKLEQYMTYLKFEQSSGVPSRVQFLFERAITEFPISSDIWLEYTRYMDKTFKASSIVRDAYYRATRNCPWIGELWVRYLLCLERGHASEEEISAVFDKALLCTFASYDEYLDIFLTRVDGLRRKILTAGRVEDNLDFSAIRKIFERAVEYLSPHLANTENLLRMYSYWARLESNLGKDLVAARGVWESLLEKSGSMVEVLQGYIAMEIGMGHLNEARSLYKKSYRKRFTGTGSEDICHAWVRFEREYGSLEDFDLAVQKVTPRLEELRLFRLQQESKGIGVPTDKKESSLEKNAREKRKSVSSLTDEQSPAKRRKDTSHNLKKSNKNDGHTQDSVGSGKVEAAASLNSTKGSVKGNGSHEPSREKPKVFNDQCTVFISNLSLQATSDDLRNFFSDVGGVVAIRILNDKFTHKSRGLAYVDFSDDAHLAKALAKNKHRLLGKKLSIARSDPRQKNKGAARHSEHGQTQKPGSEDSTTESRKQRDEKIQLKGKNTFAVPRNVRPLGFTVQHKSTSDKVEEGDEEPKSNDEFRKMFLKS